MRQALQDNTTKIRSFYLKIKDLSLEDRPREKLLQQGSSALTNAELLGILIGSGTEECNSLHIAQNILKYYNDDLNELAKCSLKDLQKFKGIGPAKAICIASAMELTRRRMSFSKSQLKCSEPKEVYKYMRGTLLDKSTEEFWILLVNNSNYLLAKKKISAGGLDSTVVDSRLIFYTAMQYSGVTSIILVHNHPSGDLEPSPQDIKLTKQIAEQGEILDITISDHLIVSNQGYRSMKTENLF